MQCNKRKIPLLLVAAGLAGCVQHHAPRPVCPNPRKVTAAQVTESLAFARAKLPNTPFLGASASKSAPGLVRLDEKGSAAPVYMDPRTHYLIIGLVVNFGDKRMRIAGGQSLLGAGSLPNQSIGGRP